MHDQRLRRLLWQYLRHTIDDHGHYREVRHGIALGCPLSPLMGAIYLHPLDEAVRTTGLCYARFMDDGVILSPTRWTLRRAIATVNHVSRLGGAETPPTSGEDHHRIHRPGL